MLLDDYIIETPIEQDTAENEEIVDVVSFVLPSRFIQNSATQLGIQYNRRIFEGWVKQPSPCCGAASVAGAYNSMFYLHRKHVSSLKHTHILDIYQILFTEKIIHQKESFERKSNISFIELVSKLHIELKPLGYYFGSSKKGNKITKLRLRKAIENLLNRYKQHHNINASEIIDSDLNHEHNHEIDRSDSCNDHYDPTMEELLLQLYSKSATIESTVVDNSEDENDEDEAEDDLVEKSSTKIPSKSISKPWKTMKCKSTSQSDDGDTGIKKLKSMAKKSSSCKSDIEIMAAGDGRNDIISITNGQLVHNEVEPQDGHDPIIPWDWMKDLFAIIKNVNGLIKLRSNKPSTAAIGNWGILQATERLSLWCDLGSTLQCRLFMGKRSAPKQKIDVPLSINDSADIVTAQWNTFKAAFSSSNTVLLFHLKNHYGLIFALREYYVPSNTLQHSDGNENDQNVCVSSNPPLESCEMNNITGNVMVRQILCPRKGQRPTAWIDFNEARQTMLGWVGYKIMAINYNPLDDNIGQNDKLTEKLLEHYHKIRDEEFGNEKACDIFSLLDTLHHNET